MKTIRLASNNPIFKIENQLKQEYIRINWLYTERISELREIADDRWLKTLSADDEEVVYDLWSLEQEAWDRKFKCKWIMYDWKKYYVNVNIWLDNETLIDYYEKYKYLLKDKRKRA